MEVNFCRQSYLVDHLVSSFKEDCIICLRKTSSKNLLLSYIVSEFLKQTSRPCLLLTSKDVEGFLGLKEWLTLFTNLALKEINGHEQDILTTDATVFLMQLECFLDSKRNELFQKSLCLLVIDLTSITVNQDILLQIRSLFDTCYGNSTRFLLLVSIHDFLQTDHQLRGALDLCSKIIPISLKISSDAVAFGSDGSVVKSAKFVIEDKTFNYTVLASMRRELEDCGEVLKFLQGNESTENENLLLETLERLRYCLVNFGIVAYLISFEDLCKVVKENENHTSEFSTHGLLLKFFKTKFLMLEALLAKLFDGERSCDIVNPRLQQMLSIVEATKKGFQKEKIKIGIVVDSTATAKVLLLTLQELELVSNYDYLGKFSVYLLETFLSDSVSTADKDVILILTKQAASLFLHKIHLNECISFQIPKNYDEFLKFKRLVKNNSGCLNFIFTSSNTESIADIERVNEFERIERTLLERIPSYIDPKMAAKRISDYDLRPFQPVDANNELTAEESIAVINRYCNFLSVGRSNFAVHTKFDFSRDEMKSQIYGRTFINFPAKSMLTRPVEAPCITLHGKEHDLIDLKIASRMATSLEACRMLQQAAELDDLFEPSRKLKQTSDNVSNQEIPVTLSQKSWYIKQIPKLLESSFPKPGTVMYIYVIETEIIENDADGVLEKYLGFCTTKRLRTLPSFLIYKRRRKLMVKINELDGKVTLTEKTARFLFDFHYYIVNYILKYGKRDSSDVTVDSNQNGLMWTVLNKIEGEYVIASSYLKSSSFPRTFAMVDQLQSLNFSCPGHLKDAIIIPSHRKKVDIFYVAERICEDIHVNDQFPSVNVATTYKDYYHFKYGIELNPNQCMVEARNKSRNLNFLVPRYREEALDQTALKASNAIILPAELCRLHPIPGHLWEQIQTIPVIIHRLSSMLLIREFQDILCLEVCLTETEQGPDIDDSINLALNRIHTERDTAMLHKIEQSFNNINNVGRGLESIPPDASQIFGQSVGVENSLCPSLEKINPSSVIVPNVISNVVKKEQPALPLTTYMVPKANVINETADWSVPKSVMSQPEGIFQNKYTVERTDQAAKRLVPPLSLLLTAMTTVEASDMFHYERLEFLGDAFLSYAVVVSLFYQDENFNEHILSSQKSNLVSNMMLYEKGNSKKLWTYLIEDRFDFKKDSMIKSVFGCLDANNVEEPKPAGNIRGCLPKLDDFTETPLLIFPDDRKEKHMHQNQNINELEFTDKVAHDGSLVAGEIENGRHRSKHLIYNDGDDNRHLPTVGSLSSSQSFFRTAIRNKAIADCVEAIIGLSFMYSGEDVALDVMEWLGYDLRSIRRRNESDGKGKDFCNSGIEGSRHLCKEYSANVNTFCEGSKLNSDRKQPDFMKGQVTLTDTNDRSPATSDRSKNTLNSSPVFLADMSQTNSRNGSFSGSLESTLECRRSNVRARFEENAAIILQTSKETFRAENKSLFYENGLPVTLEHGVIPLYIAMQLKDFERKINYEFNDQTILVEALLHPSYFRELSLEVNCNQRLEFLGDSVLYLLATDHLCRMFPLATNAELTALRSVVISTRTFAALSVVNDFQKYLMAICPELSNDVMEWARKIEQERAEGNLWPKLTMAEVHSYYAIFNKGKAWSITIPKDLADVFESVAGAIYIDSGRIELVWRTYYMLLKNVLDSLPTP